MKAVKRVGAIGVALIIAVATAYMSAFPVDRSTESAIIRTSWRTPGLAIEECRRLTEEELADIPAHMRQVEQCTGSVVDYELVVDVDGRTETVDTVGPSGIRHDRPIYVLRDLPIAPGLHAVSVRFEALVPDGYDAADAVVRLHWSGELSLASGEIALITTDASGATLLRR